MNAKLIELAERRATLVRRAATQRVELSKGLATWRWSLGMVDEGLVAMRYIGNHAALLVALVAFVGPLCSLRAGKWLRRSLLVWRMAVAVKRILPGV